MDLVYECFAKLGLRYICVLKEGKFAGVVSLPRGRPNLESDSSG